ncbi:MAG: ABC transporter substrate-binding protein, partial [Actinobacteria bacterium]|nr:ABC transporter substrate-binding protein [Actinomycetota bacterium]
DLPILADSGFDGSYWHEGIPDLSNFFYTASAALSGDDADPAINQFLTDYQARFGELPQTSFAVQGYADAQLLVEAITRAGTTDSDAVLAEFNKFTDVATLQGPTTYTPTTHFNSGAAMVINEVDGGTSKFVERLTPSYVPEPKY